VPVCYRHPDRETYVRCTRCERPICPDCMRSASVGFQCPSCVADGARSVRTPRTAFGGRVSMDTSRVTLTLIALNVAVFVISLVGVANGEYYRLITSAFLHANIVHILFNMFALAQLGPILEASLGRIRYLALYLLSAVGGSVTAFVLAAPNQPSVGASGAIFGLFGAYYVVVRRLGGETGPILVLLVVNLVLTFSVPNIDWRAHLGGLATGTVIAAAYAYVPRGPRQAALHATACVALAVAFVVAVILRTHALTT
jgi:membrane associated rhomboid family serine protease